MQNAYMNTLIQMLYFVGPLKHAVLREQFNTRHTHPEMLSRTTGLACELGMLYHQFKLIHGLTKKYSNIMRCIHSSNVISHLKQVDSFVTHTHTHIYIIHLATELTHAIVSDA